MFGGPGAELLRVREELVAHALPEFKELAARTEVLERVYPLLGFYLFVLKVDGSHFVGLDFADDFAPIKVTKTAPYLLFSSPRKTLFDDSGPNDVQVPVYNPQTLLKISKNM